MGFVSVSLASPVTADAATQDLDVAREFYGFFEWLMDTARPFYDRFMNFMTDFYYQHGNLGMVVGLVVVALAIVALVYAFRLVWFLVGLLKKLFLKMSGIERRRRERVEQARLQKKARGANYDELLEWGKSTESRAGENYWEEVVANAAAEVAVARAPGRENEEKVWEGLFSGAVPYENKLSDMERAVFSFEDKIRDLIGKITTMPKDELASETGRLRYGLEVLRQDTDRLKKLQELHPDDINISSLVELCEAFILSTKNIEKGFLAALAG